MEDRVQIETLRDDNGKVLFTYLGVYDGHGGAEASEYVRRRLMNNIVNSDLFASDDSNDILAAIREGFLETHQEMWKIVGTWPRTASGYSSTAGTTSSVAIIKNGKLYTGHVGDSAIFIGKKSDSLSSMVVERVTVDHKPESEEEQARILQAGGQVMMKSGVNRVVWTRPLRGHTGPVRRSTPTENIPFLAVARSLGDLWSYCEATKEFIVSPNPDVAVRDLTVDDFCMVLASDGLTNVLQPQQVIMIVEGEEDTGKYGLPKAVDALHRPKQTNHSRSLIASSLKNWRTFRADNITAVTVIFDHSDLSNDHPCVEEVLGMDQSIDEMFSLDPECMIRVAHDRTQKLYTYRTPLVYEGTLDANFCSVDYRGPGFITHDEEEELEERYLASKSAAEAKSTHADQQDRGTDRVREEDEVAPETDKKVPVTPPAVENPICARSSRSVTRPSTAHQAELMNRVRNGAKRVRDSFADDTMDMSPSADASKKDCESSDEEDRSELEPADEAKESTSATPSVEPADDLSSSFTKRVTRSAKLNKSLTPARPVAVAVRKMDPSNKTPRNSKTSATSTTFLQISVNERETESIGMTTRSRDRRTTVVVGLVSPVPSTSVDAFQTPSTSMNGVSSAKSSRKRGRTTRSTGVTPFVNRLLLESPSHSSVPLPQSSKAATSQSGQVHSAPSTPLKATEADAALRLGSKWSLSKLDQLRVPMEGSSERGNGEPPSKMRRIYGFVRRLVGLGHP